MSTTDEVRAIRTATALHDATQVVCLELSGDDAFATLDALCPAALSLQDAQLRATLLLRDDATVFADACVGRDDEKYWLLTEGPGAAEVERWVRDHAAGPALAVRRFDASHRLLSVHGPWAWELVAQVLGPDVMGMPYLSLLRGERALCFRSGKTGEYGYDLLVPAAEAAALRAELVATGAAWDLREVSLAALDQCALENWFFCIRREGRAGLSPLELGLQWRLSYRKDFVGAAALRQRRAKGVRSRLTCLVANGALPEGAAVEHEGAPVGRVLVAGPCEAVGGHVAAALLDADYAWPGIGELRVGAAVARTVSAPVIDNQSLYVSPQRHTWKERAAVAFPPLAR